MPPVDAARLAAARVATNLALPNSPVVTVHAVRHGLVHNPQGILYGRLPGYHLSELGRAMAERVASHLKVALDGGAVYLATSPLERAVETAEPIARELGLEVVTDPRLVEPRNMFEGTAFAVGDGVLKRPSNWRKVRDPFTPSWGEPYLSIARRMVGATYAAVAAAPAAAVSGVSSVAPSGADAGTGMHVVLVSHQLPIWTLRRYLEGKRLWHNPSKRQCSLASITSFTFTGGVLTTIAYDEPAIDLVPRSTAGATGA